MVMALLYQKPFFALSKPQFMPVLSIAKPNKNGGAKPGV